MGGILNTVGGIVGQVPIVGGLAQGALGTAGGILGGGGKGPQGGAQQPGGYGQGRPGYNPNPNQGGYGQQPAGNPMQGLDFTKQGAGESFYQQNQGAFKTPGMGENYSADVMNRYGGGNTPGVSNNAQSQYQSFQQNQPNLSANMDPFYNNAIRKGNEDIRTNMAAKGAYGSSTADDQTREMVTDLRSQQAREEAQYGLQRAGEMRGWQQTGGSLASAADASSRGQSENERAWTGTVGDIANAGQGMGMNRLGQGMNAATTAQGLQTGRGQNYFNNAMGMGDRMSGLMGQTYGNMLQGDQDAMGNSIGLATGLGAEALNQDYRNTERFMSDMERTQAMAGGGKGKGK